MANNKLKWIALVLGVLAVFCAGGWFFTSLPRWTTGGGEVGQLYSEDGEAYASEYDERHRRAGDYKRRRVALKSAGTRREARVAERAYRVEYRKIRRPP